MRCPFCQFPDNRVLESRSAESGHSVRRRRECLSCTRRFTTYERIEFVPIVVIKRNGERESFDRSKVLKGVIRASEKTGLSPAHLENLVDEIEMELQQRSIREVTSNEIGELVLKYLRRLNEVAYIRFASVYRQFQGIHDFIETLNQLQTGAAGNTLESSLEENSFAPEARNSQSQESTSPALNSVPR